MSAQAISEPLRPGEAVVPLEPLDLPDGLPSRVRGWVSRVAGLTSPDGVRWCDGSPAETDTLYATLVALDAVRVSVDDVPQLLVTASSRRPEGQSSQRGGSEGSAVPPLDQVRLHPDCQHLTLLRLFAGCMRGRVMYAVPYAVPDEAGTRLGIELTDSPWVVLNLGMAARVGPRALGRIRAGDPWTASVHSVGYPLLDETGHRRPDVSWPCNAEKWIGTFPDSGDVWSFGTGFGAARLADCLRSTSPRTPYHSRREATD
ncbi:MAG: hypothetical protein ACYC1E_01925 [Propionibacteriaceae bacterium]